MKQGVLYIAFGKNFLKEMLISAESVKKHCPDLHITVFSDKMVESKFIDHCRLIKVSHLRPKIDYIHMTPYERTLFLDTDTIVDRNIEDMFALLDNFDYAATHDLARKRRKYSKTIPDYGNIPYSFSEVNTGVMVFKKNERVLNLFQMWKDNFYKYYNFSPWDQPSFRVSLWKSIANREKQRRFHHEFGEEHLAPRIYHMHADTRINQGTYEVKNLEEALKICKNNFMEY